MAAPADTRADRRFEFLLNAMERAAHEAEPAEHGYAAKRKAVLDYVRRLERIERSVQNAAAVLHG